MIPLMPRNPHLPKALNAADSAKAIARVKRIVTESRQRQAARRVVTPEQEATLVAALDQVDSTPYSLFLVISGPGVSSRKADGTLVPQRVMMRTSIKEDPADSAAVVAVLRELISMLESPVVADPELI